MTIRTIYNAISRLTRILFLFVLFVYCGVDMVAQTQRVRGIVTQFKKKNSAAKDTIYGGEAYLFLDAKAGQANFDRMVKMRKKDENINNRDISTDGTQSSMIKFSSIDGSWSFDDVSPGNIIIVKPADYLEIRRFIVERGRENYSYTCDPPPSDEELDNVDVLPSYKKPKPGFKNGPPVEDGNEIRWEIQVMLPQMYFKNDTRFMFVPEAYEYPVDTLVGHVPPAVCDMPAYASKQLRRKSYDYEINDPLVAHLLPRSDDGSEFTFDKDYFNIKYYFRFTMPDKDKSYYYSGPWELEDYTHVYVSGEQRGSHLRRRPWRFLVTDFAVQYMELRDEWYEPPKEQVQNEPRELALEFANNQAVLLDNAKNDSIKRDIEDDMQRYRRNLQKVVIGGSASPEGNLEHNKKLAQQRADYAINWLRSRYPGINIVPEEPRVCTWEDAAQKLELRGRQDLADEIRRRIEAGTPINKVNMPEWADAIEPVLSELRAMSCSYTIRLSSPLTPEQAIDKFLNDPEYAEGGSKMFSMGDYWNIYKYLNDTLALERLTERIYRTEIRTQPRAVQNDFYAYVANRYIADEIRREHVTEKTPNILNGFVSIDTLRGGLFEDTKANGVYSRKLKYRINRSDHVANLALAYFKLQKYGKADSLAFLLPDEPRYRAVKMFTTLCAYFFKDQEAAAPALDYAWEASPLSRDVLAVELRDYLEGDKVLSNDSLHTELWKLPDTEPRKWYLLGLVHLNDTVRPQRYQGSNADEINALKTLLEQKETEAENAGNFSYYTSDEHKELEGKIKELQNTVPPLQAKDSVPDFMAFLYKCFDLDSIYYSKYYLNDYDFDEKIKLEEKDLLKKKMGIVFDYKYDKKKTNLYKQHYDDVMAYYGKDKPKKKEEETAETQNVAEEEEKQKEDEQRNDDSVNEGAESAQEENE